LGCKRSKRKWDEGTQTEGNKNNEHVLHYGVDIEEACSKKYMNSDILFSDL
jgi:hypothetical protein